MKQFLSTREETNRRLFFDIKGVNEMKSGQKFKSGMCSGIEIVDDQSFKIYLKKPNPNFLYILADLFEPIAPHEDFKDDMFTFKGIPRGSGDFEVTWSDPKSSLVRLERKNISKEVLNGKSPLSIDFFNHGNPYDNKIDIGVGAGTNGTRDKSGYTFVHGFLPIGVSVIDFNYANSISANILFRKAVSLAIDRENMFADYPFHKNHHELVPSFYYGRTNLKFDYNPQKAKQIVSENFSELSSPTKRLKGLFHGGKSDPPPKYVKKFVKQLESIGLYFEFSPAEGVYFTDKNKDVVVGTYGAVSSFADPLSSFTNYLPGAISAYHTDSKDKKSVKMYEKIRSVETRDERIKGIQELSRHFFENYRQLPLDEIYELYTYSKKIKNLNLDKTLATIDFTHIEMNLDK